MKSIKNIFLFTAAILLHTVSATTWTVTSDEEITFSCEDDGTCCTSEGSFEFPDSSSNFYCQDQNDKTCCSIGDNFGCSKDSCKVDCSTDCTVDVPGSVASTDGTVDTEGGEDDTGSSGNVDYGDGDITEGDGDVNHGDTVYGDGEITEGAGDQVTDSNIGEDGGSVTMGTGDQVSDSTIDGEAPVAVESVDVPSSGKVATLAWTMAILVVGAAAFAAM